MSGESKSDEQRDRGVRSLHRYRRPGIRLSLPLVMLAVIVACSWLIAPRVRVIEFLALLFLVYVAISALVSVCEIVVVDEGLVINRLLLPERFVPWDAVNRVIVFAHASGEVDTHIEIASISVHEGLSPLNRLPGLVYGQGFRQTIIITPDTVENYDVLMTALEEHSHVYWQKPVR